MFVAAILRPRTLVAAALALVVAGSAYGFAASNTVENSRAGDGTGTVSGYNATNVTYVLEATDPSKIDTVTFTLDAAASVVKVQLITGGTWYSADNGGSGNDWTVDPAAGALSAASVNTLRVVAHD